MVVFRRAFAGRNNIISISPCCWSSLHSKVSCSMFRSLRSLCVISFGPGFIGYREARQIPRRIYQRGIVFYADDEESDNDALIYYEKGVPLFRRLKSWSARLESFIKNHAEKEIVSRDTKDHREYEHLSALVARMGLHSQEYEYAVVISKIPLPNYRPDLDLQRPQRQVLISASTQGEVSSLLVGYFQIKGLQEKASQYLDCAKKAYTAGNRRKGVTGDQIEFHFDKDEEKNRQMKLKQQAWQKSYEGCEHLNFRRSLPVFKQRLPLLNAIYKNQVLVISGETGSGKTTQLPQYILESEIEAGRGSTCNIVCTQPRRISAISVAERVASERGEKLGDSVGYQVRLEGVRGRNTHLLFCTTGILLRRLLLDPTLKDVSHVLVDEIHERGVNEDFLLILLKELLPRRSDLRVVLMSATLNAELFAKYFGSAPVYHIPGHTYPVEVHFLEDAFEITQSRPEPFNWEDGYVFNDQGSVDKKSHRTRCKPDINNLTEDVVRKQDYSQYSINTRNALANWTSRNINITLLEDLLIHICQNEAEGAILVFLSGWEEITSLIARFKSHRLLGKSDKVLLLACHGSMATEDQKLVFDPPSPKVRKIILATNIAETSITINDVVYVVDMGKVKEMSYDALNDTSCLLPEWISQASAKQRRGRAGRVKPGICYHLYPKAVYDLLPPYQQPEILRTALHSLCLQIKSMQLGSVVDFLIKAPESPDILAVQNSLEFLKTIGALNDREELTTLGTYLSLLPVDPRIGKMLIMGSIFCCLDPILTIAAGCSVRDPFLVPMDKRELADAARSKFAKNGFSDHMVFVEAYNQWEVAMKAKTASQFCWDNFISMQTMLNMSSMRRQFLSLLKTAGFLSPSINYDEYAKDYMLVRAVICSGLFPAVVAVMKFPSKTIYKTLDDGKVQLHPNSINAKCVELSSPWLVFVEKVRTSSIFIRDSTAVSDSTLLLFGGKPSCIKPGRLGMCKDLLEFVMTPQLAKIYLQLREELDQLIQKKLLNPQLDVYKEGEQVVSAARILMNEDECTGRFFFGQNIPAPVDHARAVTPYNDLETMDSKNKLREALCNNGINIKASITSKRLGHNVFRSTVEFRRMSFTGGLASSKKQAERNACAVAVKWLNDPANTSEKNKKLWGTSRPRISLQAWKAHQQSIRDEEEEKRAQRLMDEEMEEEKSRKETMRMIKEEAEKLR